MKAKSIAECMNDFVWHNKYLTQEAKSRIYKITVCLIISYASETKSDKITTNLKNYYITEDTKMDKV